MRLAQQLFGSQFQTEVCHSLSFPVVTKQLRFRKGRAKHKKCLHISVFGVVMAGGCVGMGEGGREGVVTVYFTIRF